jgi:hypothetical protein
MKIAKFQVRCDLAKTLPISSEQCGDLVAEVGDIVLFVTDVSKPLQSFYNTEKINVWIVLYNGFPVFLWNWNTHKDPHQENWLYFLDEETTT